MEGTEHWRNAEGGFLDTLAQTGTKTPKGNRQKPEIVVQGTGTDIRSSKVLFNRAKRKMITQKLVLGLIDVATQKGAWDRVSSYWNTYHCQNRLISADGKMYGKYCKNRFCTLCSSIRKAEIINKYFPVVQSWQEPHLVTLTAQSVHAYILEQRMAKLLRGFRRIVSKYKKRAERGNGFKLVGIRSLECNFNPKAQTYNPHFHLLVPNRQTAEIFVSEWLERLPRKFASPKAQHLRPVLDTEKDLMEVVKYGTKIFTDPTMKKGIDIDPCIYLAAFDNIIAAMGKHRVFDRFGFSLQQTRYKGGTQTILTNYEEIVYDPQVFNWISGETEEILSGFKPSAKLIHILENNMDIELH